MRKDSLLYVILAVVAGFSAVMLPLQAFGVVEEAQVSALREAPAPKLAGEAEKTKVETEGVGFGPEASLIHSFYDLGIILSTGLSAALIVATISKRRITQ
ncbi:MAG: hypothetical protein QXL67_05830 [Candidatus Bathyarchaeia archaeon]